jgi:hypothetical protein
MPDLSAAVVVEAPLNDETSPKDAKK